MPRRNDPSNKELVRLVGEISETTLDSQGWIGVLERFGKLFHAGSLFFALGLNRPGFRSLFGIGMDAAHMSGFESHYYAVDPYLAAMRSRRLVEIVDYASSHSLCDNATLMRSECYNDFYKPLKLHYGFGCSLYRGPEGLCTFSLLRSEAHGPLEGQEECAVQTLLPHLRNALNLHVQLSYLKTESVTGLTGPLDAQGRAVFLLNGYGRVLRMNQSAERIAAANDGISVYPDGLRAANRTLTEELGALTRRAALASTQGALSPGGTIRLRKRSHHGSYLASVFSLRRDVTAEFFGLATPTVAVFVIDPDGKPGTNTETLQRLFGLTAAEARLAALLGGGTSLESAAEALAVSRNTARTHLQHIYQKTGTRKQGELVALLGRRALLQS